MKISSDQVGRILGAELRANKVERPAGPTPGRADLVSLSRRAEDFRIARQALENSPEVREEKVAALRLQVERGEYRVESEELAAALLQELARQRAS